MKSIYAFALLLSALLAKSQTTTLIINPNIVLPKDSSESSALTRSFNNFLISAQKPNEDNKFILESEKLETFILLDEVNGIEKNANIKDDFFYKPYLTNVAPLNGGKYLIQVSYIGTNGNRALLRASYEFIAHKTTGSYVFSSPLLNNAKNWKTEKTGNNIFHYQTTINKSKVKEFSQLTSSFDLKLKSANKITDIYCCDNLIELQKLVGVSYKSDYNGETGSVWSSSYGDRQLLVIGDDAATFNKFDPHDLWHDRLKLVIDRSQVNRPVDEGYAYLNGGSWGLSWKEIFTAFKEQIAGNRNTDWKQLKETPVYFKTKAFNNSADYVVNALLLQKIEKEKGFKGVWTLLTVGPFEKGNEKYFQTLETLTGITRANYNEKIWELVNHEK